MKKTYFLSVISILFFFTACNFTEELHITENGSGKIAINFDGSQLIQMMGDKMASEKKEEKIDSIISFKELFKEKKDSIAQLSKEEQAKLKRLENFEMHMKVDSEAKEMNFSMYSDFKKVKELGDIFGTFQEVSALQQKTTASAASKAPFGKASQGTEIKYHFKGNTFSRKTKIINEELFKKGKDSLEQARMFLEGSTYKLEYHFPRKIKSISAEKALFGQDGKSFVLEVDLLTILEDPTLLNIEVELENK